MLIMSKNLLLAAFRCDNVIDGEYSSLEDCEAACNVSSIQNISEESILSKPYKQK